MPDGRVVEARDELHDRALARAGLADERDRLAGRDAQVDAAQRLVDRVRVLEVHVVELDVARAARPGTTGSAGGGTVVGVSSSSVMRSIATRACWYESNTCDSCWIGAKNRLRYSRNAISAPTDSEPCATSTLPAPSTTHVAMSERKSTNGK